MALYEYEVAGCSYLIATACMQDMGGVAMGVFATALFNNGIRPASAVLVGIAATIKRDDVSLGDVPVASDVFTTDNIRVENGRFVFRTQGFPVDNRMRLAAGSIRETPQQHGLWRSRCHEVISKVVEELNGSGLRRTKILVPSDVELPHLLLEVGAGGPFMIADAEFGEALRIGSPQMEAVHPKLAWVEMEANGFMKAASVAEVPASVIKGISDAGDAEKAKLEKSTGGFFRAYSCSNSVVALLHLLAEKPRAPIPKAQRIVGNTGRTAARSPQELARQRRASLMSDPTNQRLLETAVDAIINERRLVRPSELWGQRNEHETRVSELCTASVLDLWLGEFLQPHLEGLAYAKPEASDEIVSWATAALETLVTEDIKRPDAAWTTTELAARCDLTESQIGVALLFLRYVISGCHLLGIRDDGRPTEVQLFRSIRTPPKQSLQSRIEQEGVGSKPTAPIVTPISSPATDRLHVTQEAERVPAAPVSMHEPEPATGIERPFASRIGNFLREYTNSPFGGRDTESAGLTQWLDDPSSSAALMLAEAGQGKSALLVNWVSNAVARKDVELAYVPISLRFDTAHIAPVARAVWSRLAFLAPSKRWIRPNDPLVALDESKDTLRSEWESARRLLVVIDGLDEAIGWKASDLLPKTIGKNIKILVAARGTESNRIHWDAQFGWPTARVFSVGPLSPSAVKELVVSVTGVGDDALNERFYKLTGGDPLVAQLHLGLLTAMTTGSATQRLERLVQDDSTAAAPLKKFFDRWWDEQRSQWGEHNNGEVIQLVLNLLACAKGPLGLTDLCALSEMDGQRIRDAVDRLRRLVVSNQGDGRYVFGHSRLQNHFFDRLQEEDAVERWRQKFLAYGQRRLAELESNASIDDETFRRRFSYVLPHYALHLQQDDPEGLFKLMSDAWLRGWQMLDGDDGLYGGFYEDVLRAESHAQTKRRHDERWRALLIKASISSLSSNVPPWLMRGLVEAKLWPLSRALRIVDRLVQDSERAKALAVLAGAVEGAEQREVLNRTLALPTSPRSLALSWMMEDLCPDNQDTALTKLLSDAVLFRRFSMVSLDRLMRALPCPLAHRLARAAKDLTNPDERVGAVVLVAVADVLEPDEQSALLDECERAIETVENLELRVHHRVSVAAVAKDRERRAQLMAAAWSDFRLLAPDADHLVSAGRGPRDDDAARGVLAVVAETVSSSDAIWNEVVEAMWAAIDSWQLPWLGLTIFGPKLGAFGFVSDVLKRTETIKLDEHSLGTLLASLLPNATEELKVEILARLGRFERRSLALEPLAYQYLHLSFEQKATYFQEVCSAVMSGTEYGFLLGRVASHMQADDSDAPRLFQAVRALKNPLRRAESLLECWNLVPEIDRDALVREVLENAREVDALEQKHRLLDRVVRAIRNDQPELLHLALEVCRKLDDEGLLATAHAAICEWLTKSGHEQDGVVLTRRSADLFETHPNWVARTYIRVLRELKGSEQRRVLWQEAAEATAKVEDAFERALINLDLMREAPGDRREATRITSNDAVDGLGDPFQRLYAGIGLLSELDEIERQERVAEIVRDISSPMSLREQFILLRRLLRQVSQSEKVLHKESLEAIFDRVLRRTSDEKDAAEEFISREDLGVVEGLAEYLDVDLVRKEIARCHPTAVGNLEALTVRLASLGHPAEAIDATRKLGFPDDRARTLSRILPYINSGDQAAVLLEARRNLNETTDNQQASEAASFLIKYLAEPERTQRLRSGLRSVVSKSDGLGRYEMLTRLVVDAIDTLPPDVLDEVSEELLEQIARQRRSTVIRDLMALIRLSDRVGGKATLMAQGSTLLDVARWFP